VTKAKSLGLKPPSPSDTALRDFLICPQELDPKGRIASGVCLNAVSRDDAGLNLVGATAKTPEKRSGFGAVKAVAVATMAFLLGIAKNSDKTKVRKVSEWTSG